MALSLFNGATHTDTETKLHKYLNNSYACDITLKTKFRKRY